MVFVVSDEIIPESHREHGEGRATLGLMVGFALSEVRPLPDDPAGSTQLGDSLLLLLGEAIFHPDIPAGHDVYLHPFAMAGWTGCLLTAINLLPLGQLDGGHIAYTVFGERFNRVTPVLFSGLCLLGVFAFSGWLMSPLSPLNWTVSFWTKPRTSSSTGPPRSTCVASPGAERWARIFDDPEARRTLEGIIHPRVRIELYEACLAAASPYAIAAIPLLAEGGGKTTYPWLHRILVVDSDPATQLSRLLARDGIDQALAARMLAAQVTREQRLAIADDVIDNNGTLEALDGAVTALDTRYLALAREQPL